MYNDILGEEIKIQLVKELPEYKINDKVKQPNGGYFYQVEFNIQDILKVYLHMSDDIYDQLPEKIHMKFILVLINKAIINGLMERFNNLDNLSGIDEHVKDLIRNIY